MSVDDVYKLVLYIVSKNKQQGYVSPDDFNLLINEGQREFANFLVGEFQQYQYGRPQARVQYGQNQTIRQRLTPIIYGYNLNVDGTGFSAYPSDFEHVDAMTSIYGVSRIRFVQQDQLYSFYNSTIDPIASNPIYLIEDRGFRFYPTSIANARLSYIKTPPNMVWGYTLDGNGRPVYNAATSTQPVWSDLDIMDIIARAIRIIGVNLNANQVSQYANEIKTNGQ